MFTANMCALTHMRRAKHQHKLNVKFFTFTKYFLFSVQLGVCIKVFSFTSCIALYPSTVSVILLQTGVGHFLHVKV